jgi:hypothetical protein
MGGTAAADGQRHPNREEAMSRHVSVHALERSIRRMSYGSVLDLTKRRAQLGYDQLAELDHQFQLPMSGTASTASAYTSLEVAFDVEFFHAPEQRDSALTVPHFTYGVVCAVTEQTTTPTGVSVGIMASAYVSEWREDPERQAITGAVITVGVNNGYSNIVVEFNGYLHATFQGYGAVAENGNDDNGVPLDIA